MLSQNLSTIQKNIVSNLKNDIPHEFYTSTFSESNKIAFESKWIPILKPHFSDKQLLRAFGTVEALSIEVPSDSPYPGGSSYCNCAKGSLFNVNCEWIQKLSCSDVCTNPTSIGCGFLMVFSCNEACKTPSPR